MAKKGLKIKLASLRSSLPSGKKVAGGAALAGLAALMVRKGFSTGAPNMASVEAQVRQAERERRGRQLADIFEQARMERALAQNQARLAQANPTLYTSVMAGRKVPTGAVVLGGRPRTDLMRELAASMDSGAFQKKDPLSELLMG